MEFLRFKPYYKWITFNTKFKIFNGLFNWSFKPYYKWITFNTLVTQKTFAEILGLSEF